MALRAVAVLGAVAVAAGCGASETRDDERIPATITNAGTPVQVGDDTRGLSVTRAWLLGVRGDFAFYRLELANAREGECWGISKVRGADPSKVYVPGSVDCAAPIDGPVLDMSVVEATVEEPVMHYWSVEGIAADNVTAVNVLDADDKVLAEIPVRDNLYHLRPVPKDAVELRAVDAGGDVLWTDGTGGVRAIRSP